MRGSSPSQGTTEGYAPPLQCLGCSSSRIYPPRQAMDLQVGVVLPFEQFVWGRDRDSLNKPPWMRRMGMKPVPTEGRGSRLRGNDEGSLILTLPTVCAVRTWMPAFAGMTEGRYSVPPSRRRWGNPATLSDRGCEVPACAGTTRAHTPPRHPHPSLLPSREKGSEPARERRGRTPRPVTLILAFSPQGRRDLSLRGNDGGRTPRPVTLILAFSPQGRRDLSLRGNDEGAHPAPSPSS